MVKLKITYTTEYGSTIKQLIVEGKDTKDALLNMLDHLHMYTTRAHIEFIEKEYNREVDSGELLDMLEEQNGHNCDLIFEIKNLTSNQVLLKGDY